MRARGWQQGPRHRNQREDMVESSYPHLALGDPLSLLPLFQFLLPLPHWTQGTCDTKRGWEKLNVHKCDQRENSGCLGLPRQTAK